MAARKVLRTNVHVARKSEFVILEAGTELPTWAAKLVTNPKAFVEDEAPATDVPSTTPQDVPSTDDELRAELTKRELPTDGTTAELVARIAADDLEKKQNEE